MFSVCHVPNSLVHRVDRVLSFLSSRLKLGLPHPLSRWRVCLPPLILGEVLSAHSLAGEGVGLGGGGGGPNSNEDTQTGVL
jgi:hypothetical protein